MSKTRELTNRIGCLDLSPKYRKRPEKLVDVGVQVTKTKKKANTNAKTKAKTKTKTQTITNTKTSIENDLKKTCRRRRFFANTPRYLKVVYFVETPLQVEIVSITALNLARMELELDLHLQQVSIPSQIPKPNTKPNTES